MNKIILCEGETDAILLSYFLDKVSGWKFCKKTPIEIAIKGDSFEHSINWYMKDNDRLLICGVGGKDKMSSFFKDKVLRPIVDAGAFSRIALVLDRDNKEIESIESHASHLFKPVVTQMKNNQWIENHYKDSYNIEKSIEALLVIVPTEHQGALETIMLDSISEDPYDKNIVDKSGEFVKEMRNVASKYIKNNRSELKAHLGVTWAIQYPEKVFRLINEQIINVEWEKSEVLLNCFEKLVQI